MFPALSYLLAPPLLPPPHLSTISGQFLLASGRWKLPAFTCAPHTVTSSQLRVGMSIRSYWQPRLIKLMKTAPAASYRWWVIREARAWVSGRIMGLCQWLQARGHRRQHDWGEGGEKGHARILLLCSGCRERLFRGAVIFSVTDQTERLGRKEETRGTGLVQGDRTGAFLIHLTNFFV